MEGKKTTLEDLIKMEKVEPQVLADFDLLAEGVFKILTEELGFVLPAIGLFDKKAGGIRFYKDNTSPQVKFFLKKITGKSINDFVFLMSDSKNLLVRSFIEKEIFVSESVGPLGYPTVSKNITDVVDKILGLKIFVVAPLIMGDQSFGVLAFGSRVNSDLSNKEINFIKNLSRKVGEYVSSQKLVNAFVQKTAILETQIEDLEKLLEIKQNFLKDLSELLSGLSTEFGINDKSKKEIDATVRYLKSLFLVADSVSTKHKKLRETLNL